MEKEKGRMTEVLITDADVDSEFRADFEGVLREEGESQQVGVVTAGAKVNRSRAAGAAKVVDVVGQRFDDTRNIGIGLGDAGVGDGSTAVVGSLLGGQLTENLRADLDGMTTE
jgi:hypothetical protein